MPANVDALVQEGMTALKAGKRNEAKQALMKAVEINEQSEQAWLWLSAVVDSLEERQICLENVLAINPGNAKAQKGLEETKRESAAKATAKPQQPSVSPFTDAFAAPADPFAGTGFDANPYAAPQKPNDPALSGWTGFDTPSTSVEWGAPPSSPVQSPPPNQPTSQEYDSWMAGMSLNSGSSNPSVPAFTGFAEDEDPFAGSPFGSNTSSSPFDSSAFGTPDPYAQATSAPAAPGASPFGDYNFEDPLPNVDPQDPFGFNKQSGNADPFGMSGNNSDPFGFGKPKSSSFDFGTIDPIPDAELAPPTLTVPIPAQAPVSDFGPIDTFEAPRFAEDDVIPAASESYQSFDFDAPAVLAPEPVVETPSRKTPARPKPQPASQSSVFTTIDSTPSLANPSIYFQQIPDDIQVESPAPSRSTPTVTASPALLISVVILLVLNIGSILFLISNLSR